MVLKKIKFLNNMHLAIRFYVIIFIKYLIKTHYYSKDIFLLKEYALIHILVFSCHGN